MLLGVDLGGTKIEAALLDTNGNVVFRERAPTPQGDYRETLHCIAELVDRAAPTSSLPVGIGTPGSLSPHTGLMRNANSVCLNGKPLLDDLQSLLRRPIRIANDADCFALSEAIDGAGKHASSVFGVILGTGTGAGLVIHKRLHQGPNAIAGEWGHNPLPWPMPAELPGHPCYCGKHGCIETWLSGPALAREYDESLSAQVVAERAASGDAKARLTLEHYVDRLARSLASVINVLDPETIVLGGGISNMAQLYRELPGKLLDYVFSDTLLTRIVPPAHGDSSGVLGAARLWQDSSPIKDG